MADLKKLAEEIVNLTLLQAQELKQILKDEYGIEPAAGGAVMMAGPAAGGAAFGGGRGGLVRRTPTGDDRGEARHEQQAQGEDSHDVSGIRERRGRPGRSVCSTDRRGAMPQTLDHMTRKRKQ